MLARERLPQSPLSADAGEVPKPPCAQSPLFQDLVELEKSSLSRRSRKLFTLSSIYAATKALVVGREQESIEAVVELVVRFWEAVGDRIPEWLMVRDREMTSGQVRRDFIHSHGIVLQSLGRAGNTLIRRHPQDWALRLDGLRLLDWSRSNVATWEGRAMIAGRVSKASQNITLTTSVIKQACNLPLTPEELRVEEAFARRIQKRDAPGQLG